MNKKPRQTKKPLTKDHRSATLKAPSPALNPQESSQGIFSSKKSYLLIDGENFVHRIEDVLKKKHLIKSRKDLKRISFKKLFNFSAFTEKLYYSTILRTPPKDHPLHKKTEQIRHWQSTWVPYLVFHGIKYIKAGYLRVRAGKECSKCGKAAEVFAEKGVDVRIAVDMVAKAAPGTTLYLVSSDTDLLPAITEAKKRGAKVIYVSFEDKTIKLISKYSSSTITIKNSQIKKAFKEMTK